MRRPGKSEKPGKNAEKREQVRATSPVIFLTLAAETQEQGSFYSLGAASYGLRSEDFLHITARREQDLLWATEEALATPGISAVILVTGHLPPLPLGFALVE